MIRVSPLSSVGTVEPHTKSRQRCRGLVGLGLGFASVLASLALGCGLGGRTRGPIPSSAVVAAAPRTFVYAGSNAGSIDVLELDIATGDFTTRSRVNPGGALSALASTPSGRALVALDDRAAVLHGFDIGAAGALTATGRASTGGTRPGRTVFDQSGKYVLVSHQASASIAVFAMRPAGGLAPPDLFPAGAGAFGMALHPSNKIVFVANAKAGTLSQLGFNEGTGTLTAPPGTAIGLPWGSGPRQVACHPNGRFVYVLNEANDTLSVHAYDDRMGTVTRLAFQVTSTIPSDRPDAKAKASPRELVVSSRAAYVLDGGLDTIVTFTIDPETGGLDGPDSEPSGGTGAAAFALEPAGRFLIVAHQGSRHVASFRLDDKSGLPGLVGSTRLVNAPLSVATARAP